MPIKISQPKLRAYLYGRRRIPSPGVTLHECGLVHFDGQGILVVEALSEADPGRHCDLNFEADLYRFVVRAGQLAGVGPSVLAVHLGDDDAAPGLAQIVR